MRGLHHHGVGKRRAAGGRTESRWAPRSPSFTTDEAASLKRLLAPSPHIDEAIQMLPDFPSLKQDLARAISRWQEERTRMYQGQLGAIARTRVFEGNRNIIIRSDGTVEETAYIRSSAQLTISLDEVEHMDLPDFLMRIDPIARDMAGQQSRKFYESMSEGLARVGNTVDANGQRLSPELFLQCLERMMIPFNADGTPHMPTLHVHPSQRGEAEAVWKQLHETPELNTRLQAIMSKKREEWDAGEADRVLVG
jgi:hypothetical protein